MKLLSLLLVCLLLGCGSGAISDRVPDTAAPNIIFILVDDAGYSDFSFMGAEIQTPNLDALMAKSVIFPNFYNNGRCSPSRASLLTGQYPQKVGVGELCNPPLETNFPGYLAYLSPRFPTIGELLQKEGYTTIMSGKWHLGGTVVRRPGEQKKWPVQRGFSNFFGFLGGQLPHFNGNAYYQENERIPAAAIGKDFYSSDVITSRAIAAIDKSNLEEDPFFLYLSYLAPHSPLEAYEETIEKYRHIYNQYDNFEAIRKKRYEALVEQHLIDANWPYNQQYYQLDASLGQSSKEEIVNDLATHAAMMERLDWNIGELVNYLEDKGELENTMIFYMSDNGASAYAVCNYANAPYYGRKALLREGGIKTPLLMYWPPLIHRTKVVQDRVHIMDILPTCFDLLDISGTTPESFQGQSFKNNLLAGENTKRPYLFWSDRKQQAAIDSTNWKWYNDQNGVNHLFDLNTDGMETRNLANQHPDKVKAFRAAYLEHRVANNILTFPQVQKGRINR